MKTCGIAVLLCMASASALADESPDALREGEGRDVVMQNCLACHAADYIVTSGGIQGRAGWEATVRKMIDVMKAPISDEDAKKIVAYLARSYGNGN